MFSLETDREALFALVDGKTDGTASSASAHLFGTLSSTSPQSSEKYRFRTIALSGKFCRLQMASLSDKERALRGTAAAHASLRLPSRGTLNNVTFSLQVRDPVLQPFMKHFRPIFLFA